MFRQLFYAVPPSWRLRLRRFVFMPYDLLFPPGHYHQIPLPPRGKIFTGAGDFIKTAERLTSYLIQQAGLSEHSRVLDIGCGLGRLAYPLSQLIKAEGYYLGFDPMPEAIDWCSQQFSRYAHFTFVQTDLYNDLYNSGGGHAESFFFPAQSGVYDVVTAISVFTHLLPDETIQYLREIKRTLSPMGHAFITFFIRSEDKDTTHRPFTFRHHLGHYSVMSSKVLRANVAYELAWLTTQIQASGLRIKMRQLGSWSGHSEGWDFQDVLVLTHAQ